MSDVPSRSIEDLVTDFQLKRLELRRVAEAYVLSKSTNDLPLLHAARQCIAAEDLALARRATDVERAMMDGRPA